MDANWTNTPVQGGFPNNGNGGVATYDAVINASGSPYTVTLGGTNITIGNLTLSSTSATLLQTSGTLTATGAITLTSGTFQLNGGTVNNSTINIAGGSLAASSNTSSLLNSVAVNGDINLAASTASLQITGGSTFNTAHLSGYYSNIGYAAGQTLNGTVLFEGNGNGIGGNRYVSVTGTGGTFTIGAGGVIRTGTGLSTTGAHIGTGYNYTGAMTLVNQGLISSETSGQTVFVDPVSLTNSGTMQAINGGILNIQPVNTWTNSGSINVNASTVNLGGTFNATSGIGTWLNTSGTVNILGTVLNTAHTFTLDNSTGSWTLSGGTITGGTMAFAGGQTLLVSANLANQLNNVVVNGDINLAASTASLQITGGSTFNTAHLSGYYSNIGYAAGQTLNGTVLFEGNGNGIGGNRYVSVTGTGGTFTIGAGGVIRTGTGLSTTGAHIGTGYNYTGAMTLVNQGLISSETSGQTVFVDPVSLTNSGTMQAINGGILNIQPVNTWTNSGSINVNASTVNLGGTFNATSGIGTWLNTSGTVNILGTVLNTAHTFTLDNSTGSWTLSGGTITGGTMAFAGGQTLLVSANLANQLNNVVVNGDINLAASTASLQITGGSTFNTAHLSGYYSNIGYAAGQTLNGTVLFEGNGNGIGGNRYVSVTGTGGTFTIGAGGVIRTGTGLSTTGAHIGTGYNYTGAMTLVNQGLISSETSGQTVFVDPVSLTNSGTMQAINGGILNIQPVNTWTNSGSINVNASTVNLGGTFNATSGIGTWLNTSGTVNILGTVLNTAHTFTLDNSTGSWTLSGGTITGGTMAFAGGQTLLVSANLANQLNNVVVNGDINLAASTASLQITGGSTFNTAHLSGYYSNIGYAAGQTLNGTVLFEGNGNGIGGNRYVSVTGTGGTFTIGAGGVIRTGTGLSTTGAHIGTGYNYVGAMTLVNQGLISSETSGQTVFVDPVSLTNSGTMQAINGGILNIQPVNTWTNSGSINVNASTVNLGGTFNATSGIGTWLNTSGTVNILGTVLNTAHTFTLDNSTGSWTLSGGTITGGTMAFAGGQTLLVSANLANQLNNVVVNGDINLAASTASLQITGGSTFNTAHLSGYYSNIGYAAGQTLNGTVLFEGNGNGIGGNRYVSVTGTGGTFTIGAGGVIRTGTGLSTTGAHIGTGYNYVGAMTLVNQGLISSETSGQTVFVDPVSLTNSGTMQAINGGILNVPGGYTQTAGDTLVNSGTVSTVSVSGTGVITILHGSLEGNGKIASNVSNAGTISPGLSPGRLDITGDLSLTPTSDIKIELSGTTQGTQYDLLTEAGNVALNLNGTLSVSLINNFLGQIQPSNTFTIISSNQAITGTFTNVVNGRISNVDGSGSFAVNVVGSNVILSAYQVPEPSAILLVCIGLGIAGLRRKRQR